MRPDLERAPPLQAPGRHILCHRARFISWAVRQKLAKHSSTSSPRETPQAQYVRRPPARRMHDAAGDRSACARGAGPISHSGAHCTHQGTFRRRCHCDSWFWRTWAIETKNSRNRPKTHDSPSPSRLNTKGGGGGLSGDNFAGEIAPLRNVAKFGGCALQRHPCVRLPHALPLSGGVPDGILAAIL